MRCTRRFCGKRGPPHSFIPTSTTNQPHDSVPSDLPSPLAGADCVVKGDSKVRCIAAASILAKVTRDRIMVGAGTESMRALLLE